MKRNLTETSRIGRRGVFTIPSALRERFGLTDGSLVIAEEREDGILLRPALTAPVETYSDEQIAQFLLTNAIDTNDYNVARQEVEAMGLDPDRISHRKPAT